MPNAQILFWSVTINSASAAAAIACTVDTRQRPAAHPSGNPWAKPPDDNLLEKI